MSPIANVVFLTHLLLNFILFPVHTISSQDPIAEDGSCPDNTIDTITHSSAFGTSLFALLANDPSRHDQNILFSPLSITQSLALIRDGATTQSVNEAELSSLLGPPSLLEQARELHSRTLGQTADQDADVKLKIATSIWAEKLKSSYIDLAKSTHLAEAYPMPKSYAAINTWVSENTDGLITEIMDASQPVDQSMTGLLVNAVHFRGSWSENFSANKTIDGDFFLKPASADSKEIKTPAKFMTASREMEVIPQSTELGGASVLVLDYGKHVPFGPEKRIPEFSAIFILPASSDLDSMASVVDGLNSRPISDLLAEVRKMDVKLKLPRFRLSFGPSSLKPALKRMGMKSAFEAANLNKFLQMSEDPTHHIGDILHGATMEISEEGTVAAAVTVTKMRSLSMVIKPPPFELTFDRPFVVVVVHRPIGMPLFVGKVTNPEFMFSSSF